MAPDFLSRAKHFIRDRDTKFLSRFKKKRYGDPNNGVAARSTEKVEFPPPELAASSTTLPAYPVWQPATPIAGHLPPTWSASQPSLPELYMPLALPERPETAVPRSLWDRAYDALRARDGRLVEKYEKLLSRELVETTSNLTVLSIDSPDKAEKNLDETDNRINNTDPQERRVQLDTVIESGLRRMDGGKPRYHIAGHEFVVRDQITQAAGLAQGIKNFIGEAVKASREASLPWAGVCAILPILLDPSAVEQANNDGFTYVTSRMRFYVALESLLLPRDQDQTDAVPKDLKNECETRIVDLYQHVLDFQFRSVLRFYRSWLADPGQDMIQHEDWKGRLSKLQELEKAITDDFKKINDLSSRKELEKLGEDASGSLETMKSLLLVAERQLQAQEEGLQVQKKIANLADGKHDAGQDVFNLPMAESPLYDSAADQDIPVCHPGTRVSILNQITTWASDAESEIMFWVSGPAGTGKSTISRTLVHSLTNMDKLGASYFFKRRGEGRNGTATFFPTIANQLANTIPEFRACLKKSLESLGNVKVEKTALEEQFKTLIQTPLFEMIPDKSGILTRVIVIDALDECDRHDEAARICDLLSQLRGLNAVRLLVFLTSRPAHPVVGTFEELKSKRVAYRSLTLDQAFHEETVADLTTLLEARFADIKAKTKVKREPWPDREDLVRLVSLASQPSPLFIYAATLCRFIYDGTGKKNPISQLEFWLEQYDSSAPQLSQTYVPVLRQVLLGSEKNADPLDSDGRLQLLQILGSIILLATPLSTRGLAALLEMDEDTVNHWLRNLHAILSVPPDSSTPVRLLHTSFSDFLLGHEGTGTDSFRVNAQETHAMLALKCIQRMTSSNGLRMDICNVQAPGKSSDEIDEVTVARHIPPDLEYACLYWVYHLQHSGRIGDEDKIYDFLQTHLLHWLESLSYLRKLPDGILSIKELLKIVQSSSDMSSPFARFLRDAEKFASSFGSIIERAPLQAYGAALVFCPTTSKVKQRYWEQRLPFLKSVKGTKHGWDVLSQALKGHTDSVWAVAFSSDGKTIASASRDKTIRLWDAATGAHKQILEDHSDWVLTVAFSPDGKTVASGSRDKTIRLWDAATGAHKQTLKGHSNGVLAVAFSPDGKTIVSASDDKTVRLWDAIIGDYKQTFKGHSSEVRAVAFSPDGKMVASASRDKTVRLWDAITGAHKHTLEGHNDCVWAVAFSPDGKTVASASLDKMVRLWDAATGVYIQTFEGHGDKVRAVAFSPDSKMVASASDDKTVRLWDAATGACIEALKGHGDWVRAVDFSPDGEMVVSASDDKTVRFWDTTSGAYTHATGGHSGEVRAVAFSPDGKMVASASRDKTVQLWDAATGAHMQTFEGHNDWVLTVVFSPDGEMIASASYDKTVRLWDVAAGTHKQTLEGHSDWVLAVAFSPDGKTIASASYDKTVRLWDAATGAHKLTLEGHSDCARAVAFSPDGKTVVSASYDMTVRLWDAANGAHKQTFEGHTNSVLAVAFSTDGKTVVSISLDGTIRFWNTVAAGSRDKAIRLWNAATGIYKHIFDSHNFITSLSFSEDGRYLRTNGGLLCINPSSINADLGREDLARAVFVNKDWITRDEQNAIWLPQDYRATCAAFYDNILVLGHDTGRMTFFGFSSS